MVFPSPIGPPIINGVVTVPARVIIRAASARASSRPTKVLEPMGSCAGRAAATPSKAGEVTRCVVDIGRGRDVGGPASTGAAAALAGRPGPRALRSPAACPAAGVAPCAAASSRHRRSQAAGSPPQAATNASVTGNDGSR